MSKIAKKKRISKKNKISWRKYSNIDDVTEFLEEQRQDERIGKIVDKSNEELFVIDTKKNLPKKSNLTERQRRKQVALRPPRCFASLENTSNVQDPITKRNHVRTKEERKHFIAKSIDMANKAKGIIPMRQQQSMNDRLAARKKVIVSKKNKWKPKFASKDVWEEGELKNDFKIQWIDKNVEEYHLMNTGAPKVTVPKTLSHIPSQLISVTVPHPGTSYNPSLKDHQDLLTQVENEETKIIQKEEHLDRVTTSMFNKMTTKQRDDELLQQLEQLEEDGDTEKNIEDDSDLPYKSVNPPTVVKPKLKSARKLREQNQIKNALQDIKLEKKKITDIHRIKHLACDIDKSTAELSVIKAAKKLNRELKKQTPRRISKQKYKEIDTEIAMPQDITGNLRNVKVEGSILTDRFKSMQQRNILPPTVDLGLRRRREIKRFVRKSHQEELPQPNAKKIKK